MSSISGIGGSGGSSGNWMTQGVRQRPDPAKMAEELFAKLDTSGQGYLSKADLQSALDSTSASSSASASKVDTLFSKLDANGDGKVTKDEFTDVLKKVAEQLDNQFMNARMNEGMSGAGGMPPPPPPGAGDGGFTKDQLSSQLDEVGSSDSQRSTLITNIVNNFDKADTDGDGKVSFKEAMAYDRSTSASSSSTASSTGSTSSASEADTNAKLMMQIMKLMQAYNVGNDEGQASNLLSVLA